MTGRRRRPGFRDALRIYIAEHDRVRSAGTEPPVAEDVGGTAPPPPRARFGVGIPDRLHFHRGPAMWRPTDAPGTSGSGGPDGT
jgi:hypothetical protein